MLEGVVKTVPQGYFDNGLWLVNSLQEFLEEVSSLDNNLQLEATTYVRKLLSIGGHSSYSIVKVIQSGVVPRLVEFLMKEDFPQLQ
ncbi:importin subunit alpha-2-like protein, partial [Tanacetum coccineum]